MKNDFTQARRKLVILYLLIVGTIIVVFSLLIIYQANDSFSDPAVKTSADLLLGATEVEALARDLFPEREIEETEYEIENGVLYYTVSFGDDEEVKVDLLSGSTYLPKEEGSLIELLTDDFDERVGWIALLVFLAASWLSVFVANRTFVPIVKSIQRQKKFVADAAHELRNPLAALHARIESAMLYGETTKKEVFEDLLSETKRLISLSEGLLVLEKNAHGRGEPETLVVKEVVREVLSRLEFLSVSKKLHIKTDIDEVSLTLQRADLETVLYNLLHNAIKFSGTRGKITIAWKHKILTIADSGVGIVAEKIPYIFDRFYKADVARAGEGSGLGLAIVKSIVDRNNATITVVSTLSKGTAISIHF